MTVGVAFDQVLAGAQTGAGWACTRLYESLAPAVAGYLRTRGARDADDVASDVFLAVFARLETFSGTEAKFRSWVFTIAHHRLVDQHRATRRRPQLESLDAAATAAEAAPGAEDVAFAAMSSERVERLLGTLSHDQRDVLALRVLADLTVEQVADVLGKQPGAVKALQRRALATLRRNLASEAVPL